MSWRGLSDFAAMGGYGLYVWGSYAVALLLMLLEPALAALRHRAALRAVADDEEPSA